MRASCPTLSVLTSLTLLFTLTSALADSEDFERESRIEIGVGYSDSSAYRYGKYSGLSDEGAELLLDIELDIRPRSNSGETRYGYLRGTRLGLPSRRFDLELGEQGSQRLRLSYREFPKYLFEDGRSPFRGGGAVLTLPPDWVAAGHTTADMPRLQQSLGSLNIREERQRLDLAYLREINDSVRLQFDYQYEVREGKRPIGGVIGSNGGNARAAILAAPVDSDTHQFTVAIQRQAQRYQLSASYHASLFNNNRDLLIWDNPFGQQPQWAAGVGYPDGQGRLGLDPDNRFHQLRVGASYRFGRATSASLDLARGRMTQDEDFLPYTINPLLLIAEGLPRQSLDGRIDTTLLHLRVSSQLTPRLNIVSAYRYDDRDNKTPVAAYRYVPGDAQNQIAADNARLNRPYSFNEQKFTVDARYRLTRGVRLHGGYEYRNSERDFSEITRSEEQGYKAGLRLRAIDNLSLSADYLHQRRDVGRYEGNRPLRDTRLPGTVAADDFENHPLLRKYYLADRERDQFRLRADLQLHPQLSLGLANSYSRDDYQRSVFGLNEATVKSWSADVAYFPSDNSRFTLFYSVDRFDSEQSGRAFNNSPAQSADPERNWVYGSRDRFDSTGFTAQLDHVERWLGTYWQQALPGRLELEFKLLHAHSRGQIDVDSGAALTTESLPDVFTRLDSAGVSARYHLSSASSLRLGVEHERYRERDFSRDSVEPATIAAVLDLGESSPRYRVNWIFVSYAYSF